MKARFPFLFLALGGAVVLIGAHRASAAAPVPIVRQADAFAESPPLETIPPPTPGGPEAIPSPTLTFEGLSVQDATTYLGASYLPPDPSGDVGPNHYVQAVNGLFRVFDKSGVPLTLPTTLASLFDPLGAPCNGGINSGLYPLVVYDPLADRWVISQVAYASLGGTNCGCLAVSKTGDPTGGYFLYKFVLSPNLLMDYAQTGVWPDGYYMSADQFTGSSTFAGVGVFAFDRLKMLAGDPTASFIYFNVNSINSTFIGLQPSDFDGLIPPPAGASNVFATIRDSTDSMVLFNFHADFANPSNSSFTTNTPLPVNAFDSTNPTGRDDIEQPGVASTAYLDAYDRRLMRRLQYRNSGSQESLVVNHTANVGGVGTTPATHQAGIRYYELRRALPAGAFTVAEQGTFAPDSDNRWMGSAAMDHQGNLAVGYSVSSVTVFPSLRYAGRLASDPAGSLAQGEAVLINGSGAQTSTLSRWGDYSALSLDPVNDCDFWYTGEYIALTGGVTWRTRIGKFNFGVCPPSPRGSLNVTLTRCNSGSPATNINVTTSGGYFRSSDINGLAAFTPINPGTHTITVARGGYSILTTNATVTNGATTTLNLCLPQPTLNARRTNGAVVLSWPAWASDYRLESTGTLPAAAGAWATVPQPPSLSAGELAVQLGIGPTNRFFRLANP